MLINEDGMIPVPTLLRVGTGTVNFEKTKQNTINTYLRVVRTYRCIRSTSYTRLYVTLFVVVSDVE